MSGQLVRKTVIFFGRVQGVGFRYHTLRSAAGFHVTGTVENLQDGTVKMIVEGREAELDRMIEAICESSPGHIANLDVQKRDAQGNFEDFSISR